MDDAPERQLNIHMEPQHLAGVYANFANITFSDYEFTLTFARIDHEVEEGDVPGVVVTRQSRASRICPRRTSTPDPPLIPVEDRADG
jgi:hypothetical protein